MEYSFQEIKGRNIPTILDSKLPNANSSQNLCGSCGFGENDCLCASHPSMETPANLNCSLSTFSNHTIVLWKTVIETQLVTAWAQSKSGLSAKVGDLGHATSQQQDNPHLTSVGWGEGGALAPSSSIPPLKTSCFKHIYFFFLDGFTKAHNIMEVNHSQKLFSRFLFFFLFTMGVSWRKDFRFPDI